MKERPIIFSGEMVRAILEGRKTQTRRVIKAPILHRNDGEVWDIRDNGPKWRFQATSFRNRHAPHAIGWFDLKCPCGQPGDRLWVRETFCETDLLGGPAVVWRADGASYYVGSDGDWSNGRPNYFLLDPMEEPPYDDFHWRPSIHMPRWASRILLEVTDVRVERVRDISEADAQSEGVSRPEYGPFEVAGMPVHPMTGAYREGFQAIWDSINAKRGYGWDANPWVWVVNFKRIAP